MEARIRFYRITQCGYYDHLTFKFGDIAESLDNLKSWITRKALNETQTYTIDTACEGDILRTFCYSVDFNAGEYLVTTWNENTDVGGKIASIDGLGMTGEALVDAVAPRPGYIPGYPAFFWFIPSRNIFATIQFNTRLNGRKNLNAYMKGFLDTRSQYVIYDEIDGGINVVGYGISEDDYGHPQPKFSSVLYKQLGQIEYIIRNRESIRKLIKKDKLILEREETTNLWQALFRMFTGTQPSSICRAENKVFVGLDMTPSADELERIISQWETDSETYPVADVGFILNGNQQPFWLRKSLASDSFDLDIHFTDENVLVPTAWLLSELQRRRNVILKIIHN